MRADMDKVIVERPRRGGNNTRRGRAVPEELQPAHEGMRAPHVRQHSGKELNEYLAPLYRFLRSRAGTPWNKVWSEISAHIRATNAVQQHVRDHVLMWVCTKTRVDADGVIWLLDGAPRPVSSGWCHFYVDPTTGHLMYNSHRESWKKRRQALKNQQDQELADIKRTLPTGAELRKHGGLWYEVELAPVPRPEMVVGWVDSKGVARKVQRAVPVYDVLLKKVISETHGVYVVCKRQLNHQELKTYGVVND